MSYAAQPRADDRALSKTPLFQEVMGRLSLDRRNEILDLGEVLERNIEFFFSYPVALRLHYPDFSYSLMEMRQAVEQEAKPEENLSANLQNDLQQEKCEKSKDQLTQAENKLESQSKKHISETEITQLLSLPTSIQNADAVLTWDILQYLERSEMVPFVTQIAEMMRSGALLHLICSTHPAIPVRPMRCVIQGESHLHFSAKELQVRPAPRYSQREWMDWFARGGFRFHRSTLLNNGLQEMVFELK